VHGSVAGLPVAAIVHAAGDASGWLLHIEVDNVATAVDTVIRAGGNTLIPATADTDAAIAVVTDSSGTRFGLHQFGAPQHGRSSSPGAFAWGELISDDLDASAAFYNAAFDWHLTGPEGPLGRREWRLNGHAVSGLLPRPPAMPAETPAYWDVYFSVPDLEAAVTTAVERNATPLLPPTPIEIGTIAVLLDPAGAIWGAISASIAAATRSASRAARPGSPGVDDGPAGKRVEREVLGRVLMQNTPPPRCRRGTPSQADVR
jgi:predicted enzyme related to lactoylglutathione lyase